MRAYKLFPLTALILLITQPGNAQVSANFSGGLGTESPDQYAGAAGSGWVAGWQAISNNEDSTLSVTVSSDTPLTRGGGNYLSATLDAAGTRRSAVSRDYTDFGSLALANPHTITFSYRLDAWDQFTGKQAYIDLFDQNSANAGTSFGSNSTWGIRAFGSNDGGAVAQKWAFYDGNPGDPNYSTNNYVDSGMAVTAGVTYFFTIDVDPANRSWVVTVNDGTTSITSDSLLFRTTDTEAKGFIHFGAQTSTASTLSFSVDDIHIASAVVPEPASAALLFGTTALVLFGVSRGRQRRR